MRKTNLSGGAKICRGAAGAGVWQGGASTAAHWGRWSSTSGGFWNGGGLTQDTIPLETSPCRAPAKEEFIQQLHLESETKKRKKLKSQC